MSAPAAVVNCARVPIVACEPADAAAELLRLARAVPGRRGVHVHLCNAFTLAQADRDPVLRRLLREGVNFPDGKSVVWANRLRHRALGLPKNRVYGPDLLLDVLAAERGDGLRHYLLGSTEPVLGRLAERLLDRYPGLVIAGAESPPFRPLTAAEQGAQAERIARSGAHLVWVGLGTPKQDWECARIAARLPVLAVGVGAAFDFLAGTKRQAPVWMQRNGLEWVFRLGIEPRRLWRRYLFGNARFLRAALRAGG